jgi:hypothetical protein
VRARCEQGKPIATGAIFLFLRKCCFQQERQSYLGYFTERSFGGSVMSNASLTSRPLGTAMVGGAIAMALLDLLVRKNLLTVDDVQGALTTAQSSLISSPTVHGALDGAGVIGEIKDLFARGERGRWSERRR